MWLGVVLLLLVPWHPSFNLSFYQCIDKAIQEYYDFFNKDFCVLVSASF